MSKINWKEINVLSEETGLSEEDIFYLGDYKNKKIIDNAINHTKERIKKLKDELSGYKKLKKFVNGKKDE